MSQGRLSWGKSIWIPWNAGGKWWREGGMWNSICKGSEWGTVFEELKEAMSLSCRGWENGGHALARGNTHRRVLLGRLRMRVFVINAELEMIGEVEATVKPYAPFLSWEDHWLLFGKWWGLERESRQGDQLEGCIWSRRKVTFVQTRWRLGLRGAHGIKRKKT